MRMGDVLYFSPRFRFIDLDPAEAAGFVEALKDRVNIPDFGGDRKKAEKTGSRQRSAPCDAGASSAPAIWGFLAENRTCRPAP